MCTIDIDSIPGLTKEELRAKSKAEREARKQREIEIEKLKAEKIELVVLKKYSISSKEIRYRVRREEIREPRQVLMNLIKAKTSLGPVEIGKYMGGFKHDLVIHSINTINNMIETDKEFRDEFIRMDNLINRILKIKKSKTN